MVIAICTSNSNFSLTLFYKVLLDGLYYIKFTLTGLNHSLKREMMKATYTLWFHKDTPDVQAKDLIQLVEKIVYHFEPSHVASFG